jgi:hypothetical protein
MKLPRISPPYRAYSLDARGNRTPLEAHGVVIELRPGIEIEVNLAPHPNFRGRLPVHTPPMAEMERLYDEGLVDDFAVVFGASNVLHVMVERRAASRAKGKNRGSSKRPGQARPRAK